MRLMKKLTTYSLLIIHDYLTTFAIKTQKNIKSKFETGNIKTIIIKPKNSLKYPNGTKTPIVTMLKQYPKKTVIVNLITLFLLGVLFLNVRLLCILY
jgi:hypothetical protein